MYCIIYINACMLASPFFPLHQVKFSDVNDRDISKCLEKQSALPAFERGDGTPGGPELAKGSRDGEKANLLKMKWDQVIHTCLSIFIVLLTAIFGTKHNLITSGCMLSIYSAEQAYIEQENIRKDMRESQCMVLFPEIDLVQTSPMV